MRRIRRIGNNIVVDIEGLSREEISIILEELKKAIKEIEKFHSFMRST